MIGGQDNRGKRKRTGAHKGNLGRCLSVVLFENGEFKVAKLKVIGIVRENIKMVKRVLMRG